jgi:hypothetical protein
MSSPAPTPKIYIEVPESHLGNRAALVPESHPVPVPELHPVPVPESHPEDSFGEARMTAPLCTRCGGPKTIRRRASRDGVSRVLHCPRCAAAAVKKWVGTNPEKRRAHKAVHSARRRGRIVALPCEVCGASPTEAHHEDYSACLDVRWLCRPCHRARHRKPHSGRTEHG